MKAKGYFLVLMALAALQVSFAREGYVRPAKIVMLWDYIGKADDNNRSEKRIVHEGLDVILPTWFSISSGGGNNNVSSLADREYVRWAHNNGIKVWAVFENRSLDGITYWALVNAEGRRSIITQIAFYAREYELDGINIDFEAMSAETGKLFEKFIAELYEKLKPLGITLSVDIPFPIEEIHRVYDINLIVQNCDYAVMMAYDQHYGSRSMAGPTAAIDWVKKGIEDTLSYIQGSRVILGIPFFTRVWTERREGGEIRISSELRGMKEAYDLFAMKTRLLERESATEQIYSEYDDGAALHKVWLEDEHSISLKLDAVNDYDLAGISAWRRGWEGEEIWDLINAYFE